LFEEEEEEHSNLLLCCAVVCLCVPEPNNNRRKKKKKKKKKKSYYLNKGRVCATPGLKGVRLFVISPLVLLLLRLYLFWGEEVPRRVDQQGPGGKSCRCLRLVSFSIFLPTTTATL
jgi:hypothetical protein